MKKKDYTILDEMVEQKIKVKQKKGLSTRNIMVFAAMFAISSIVLMVVGSILATTIFYYYLSAGISMFINATFYLIVSNRINKHGILFLWTSIHGIIYALQGYMFVLIYLIALGALCEIVMLGKDAYINPIRSAIGWTFYTAGMTFSTVFIYWIAKNELKMMMDEAGMSDTITGAYKILNSPIQIAIMILISAVLALLGCVFANNILRRHFKKAKVV